MALDFEQVGLHVRGRDRVGEDDHQPPLGQEPRLLFAACQGGVPGGQEGGRPRGTLLQRAVRHHHEVCAVRVVMCIYMWTWTCACGLRVEQLTTKQSAVRTKQFV